MGGARHEHRVHIGRVRRRPGDVGDAVARAPQALVQKSIAARVTNDPVHFVFREWPGAMGF